MNDQTQRRLRTNYQVEIELLVNGMTHFKTVSKNISLNGIFLETTHKLPVGSHCHLAIKLMPSDPPVILQIDAEVIRQATDGLGLTFTNMDIDSFNHLKNIILYNTDQTEEFLAQCNKKPGFK